MALLARKARDEAPPPPVPDAPVPEPLPEPKTDQQRVIAELLRRELIVLGFEPRLVRRPPTFWETLLRRQWVKREPKSGQTELVQFTRQLATVVAAGLPLLEGVEVLAMQSGSPGHRRTCERIALKLRDGLPLSEAMATCKRVFSDLYLSMVRVAEATGQLDVILERLADHMEAAAKLRRDVRGAMAYPIILGAVTLSISAFLLLAVVPTFREAFEGLGGRMPGLTRAVLAISQSMRANWIEIAVAGGALGVGLAAALRTHPGQEIAHRALLFAPILGSTYRRVVLARFARCLATLTRSGVPILQSLDVVSDVAANRLVSREIQECRKAVREGSTLAERMRGSRVFPPMVVRMIAVGEASGALEGLLGKIAEFYESQVRSAVKGMTALLEPLMVAVLGLVVGTILMAIFLALIPLVLDGQFA